MAKPPTTSHAVYFQKYIDQVPEEDLGTAFSNQLPIITAFLQSIPEEKTVFAYAAGKWTIKEVLQHLIDAERVFDYRALCFARNEKTSLPGFDENEYAAHSHAGNRNWNSLVEEFLTLRRSTQQLFESLTPEALSNKGISNNNTMTAASLGFISVGHVYHHKKILEERYLTT